MARPVAEDPKSETVTVRLTKGEREQLDRDRGALSLTDYIRQRVLKGQRP
jgi:hypothetical protein